MRSFYYSLVMQTGQKDKIFAISGIFFLYFSLMELSGKTGNGDGSRLRYIPLQSSAGVHGIMGVNPAEPDGIITHEEERILTAFANQMALALERVNLIRTSQR